MKNKKIRKPTETALAAAWRVVARYYLAQEREIAKDDGRKADNDTMCELLAEEFTRGPAQDYMCTVHELMEEEKK